MRTELKIGITALLVVSTAVLLYFVFTSDRQAKPTKGPDIPIARSPDASPPAHPSGTRGPTARRASPTPAVSPDPSPVTLRDGTSPTTAPSGVSVIPLRSEPTPSPTPLATLSSPRPEPARSPAPTFEPTPIYMGTRDTSLRADSLTGPVDGRPTLGPVRPTADADAAGTPSGLLVRKADGKDYYKVQKGDNGPWAIAEKVYKDGRKWDIITRANPGLDPARLQPGQELVIPTLVAVSDTRPLTSTTRPTSRGAHGLYAVKAGDTLDSIARTQYGNGALWEAISKANPGVDPRRLRIGQELVIPPKSDVVRSSGTASSGGATSRPALARDTSPTRAPAVPVERPRTVSGWD